MKWSIATLGLAATTVVAMPQAAADNLKPDAKAPEGCSANYDGDFQVSIFKLGNGKRDVIQKRDCAGPNTLLLNLKDSVLKDRQGRTGAIVANYQFQFDGPPQAGSIYTAGWSTCTNGTLALGSSTVFYQCLSGDFYNLYDRNWAPQCEPIEIVAMGCKGNKPETGGDSGKKPVGTSMVVTTVVTVLSDGQPQVRPTTIPVPMCQIGDGQIQAHATPCDKVPVVSQIGDGQIQAPGKPITQISDGQIQAPTKTGGAPITQISDGQVQAPTKTAVPTQTPGIPISQISDGQVQAPNKTGPAPTTAPVPTAAAGKSVPQIMGALALAGVGAVLFL